MTGYLLSLVLCFFFSHVNGQSSGKDFVRDGALGNDQGSKREKCHHFSISTETATYPEPVVVLGYC